VVLVFEVVVELTVVVSEVLTIFGVLELTMVVLDVSEAATIFVVVGIVVVDNCDITSVVSLVFATVVRLQKIIRQELKHKLLK
jgi:hypothetical protein